MIDLRSDTVTRPTPAMREAMARADVGDDVLGDDPTVRALEEEVARIVGKEAALFVSSGTMGNQLAIATQTRPGDEVVVGEWAHPVLYESAAGAALSGVQFQVAGRGGLFTAEEIEAAVQPPVYWAPRTSLVAIENTHNRAGGRVWPVSQVASVVERARSLGLALHLDGARIWNAAVALSTEVATLCRGFDTVSVCFSKGLGAPVGSAFCGTRALVEEARRFRKRWGGGMRQVGIVAAGALHALVHHRARLAEDHANARALALGVAKTEGAHVAMGAVETNIVNIDVEAREGGSAASPEGRDLAGAVAEHAKAMGVLISASARGRLRAVTHLDVTRRDIDTTVEVLARAIARAREG